MGLIFWGKQQVWSNHLHEKTLHIVSTKIVHYVAQITNVHCLRWLNLHFNDILRGMKWNQCMGNKISTLQSKDKIVFSIYIKFGVRKPYLFCLVESIHFSTTLHFLHFNHVSFKTIFLICYFSLRPCMLDIIIYRYVAYAIEQCHNKWSIIKTQLWRHVLIMK